jgi:hypothetical protein
MAIRSLARSGVAGGKYLNFLAGNEAFKPGLGFLIQISDSAYTFGVQVVASTVDFLGNVYAISKGQGANTTRHYKIDPYGNTISRQNNNSVTATEWFNQVSTADGGYIASGVNSTTAYLNKWTTDLAGSWGRSYTSGQYVINNAGPTAVDANGNIFWNPAQSASMVSSALVKYNSSGTIQWQRLISNMTSPQPSGVTTDGNGNAYVAFQTGGPTYSSRLAIIKYNSAGTRQWNLFYDLGQYAGRQQEGMFADASENLYFLASDPTSGWYVVKVNSAGTIQWQRRFASSGSTVGGSLTCDNAGNVYIWAHGNGATSGHLVKYNSSGTIQWQRGIVIGGSSNPTSAAGTGFKWSTAGFITFGFGGSGTVGGGGGLIGGIIQYPDTGVVNSGTYTAGILNVTFSATSITDSAATGTFASAGLNDSAATGTDSNGAAYSMSANTTATLNKIGIP